MIEELDNPRLSSGNLELDLHSIVLECEWHVEAVDHDRPDRREVLLVLGDTKSPTNGPRVLEAKPRREKPDLDHIARNRSRQTSSRQLGGQGRPGQRGLHTEQTGDVVLELLVAIAKIVVMLDQQRGLAHEEIERGIQ